MGGGWLILGCGWGDREWVSSYSFFSCAFVFCCLMFWVPLFWWLEHDGCCVCFFVFSLFSLSLVPLVGVTSAEKLLCLLYKTILKVNYPIIILWISLEKGECFDFNHSLGCVYPTLYIIRLLCWVYHFSLLICYPSSSGAINSKTKSHKIE